MYKRVKYFFSFFIVLTLFLSMEILYLQSTKYSKENIEDKRSFVETIGLPDLALTTSASYIRHRSLNTTYGIFSDGAEHIEYFPSTFAISYGDKR